MDVSVNEILSSSPSIQNHALIGNQSVRNNPGPSAQKPSAEKSKKSMKKKNTLSSDFLSRSQSKNKSKSSSGWNSSDD